MLKLVFGIIAATLTSLSFIAQTQKVIRTRDTSSLSLPMWILSTSSFAVWVAYGAVSRELPILIPNILCGVLAAVILTLKIRS